MTAIAPRQPSPPYRKGWCPGALRPMETGDGLLARVRAPRGRLSLNQAEALADAACRCGNGAIGLSARANLHLRGLSERTLSDLHARLAEAGLLDADPEVERLRNIVMSPVDDLDPEASFDLGPSVAALEARLKQDERLRRLPAKFSFVLDTGGRLPLGDVDADIRFEALRGGMFAVFLAGEDALAAECAPAETGDVASQLGLAFLALAGAERSGAEGGCARSSSAEGRRQCSRARLYERSLACVRNGAAALRDGLGAQAFGSMAWSARPRPSANSRPCVSRRSSSALAPLARQASGLRHGGRS